MLSPNIWDFPLNPTLSSCRLAQRYRVGSVVTSFEKMFWFEYGQTIFLFFIFFLFLNVNKKSLGSLYSIKCFAIHHFHILILYLNYVHFKTKHNLYSNEHALNAWLIVLHMLDIMIYFLR